MREQSTQDPTTRLPSRSALLEHLEEAIRDADRNDRPLALITPRLDELQEINDSLGPDNGDVILRQVAARAHNTVRQDDVVARLDVNEFGVLLHCLGFQVVANGVENLQTWKLLQELEADLAQGSYLSGQLTGEELLTRFSGGSPALTPVLAQTGRRG